MVLALMLCARVGVDYALYQNLPFEKPGEIEALVISQYQKHKNAKPYWVLKLSSNAHTLYTTSKEDIKILQGRKIRLYGKINSKQDCSFMQYFRSCFFIGFSISTLPQRESTAPLKAYIASQHANHPIHKPIHHDTNQAPNASYTNHAGLFSALFLATPLPKAWRDVSNTLGLAHIFAISGFHLGIISFVLFALLVKPYRALQKRYFSYRNEAYDLGAIVLVLLFGYLVILDFAPSFLRAFVMAAVGFALYISGLHLISFSLLGLCALLCAIAFPNVLVNRGFLLSVAGVFYIFVLLRYMPTPSHKPNHTQQNPNPAQNSANNLTASYGAWAGILLRVLWLHVGVFLLIIPVVHVFFPYFSPWQLVSIPVSMAFVVLFPLAIMLHIFGAGGVLDSWLDLVLGLEIASMDIVTPWWFLCVYLGASAWAMLSRAGYYVLLLLAVGFYGACLWVYGIGEI